MVAPGRDSSLQGHPKTGRIGLLLAVVSLLAVGAFAVPARTLVVGAGSSDSFGLPTLARQGLVVPMGNLPAPDGLQVGYPSVLYDHGVYKMWYFEVQASPWYAQIAYATSPDGRNWTKQGTVLSPTLPDETFDVAYPTVALVNGTYWMWYVGYDGSVYRIFAATSPDGMNWTKHGVVLDVGPAGSQDSASVGYPFVLCVNGTFDMWYTGLTSFSAPDNAAIMFATSADGLNWTKEGTVLTPGGSGSIDSYNVFTAGVVQDGSRFVMVYMGQDASTATRMLWAVSADGAHWEKAGVALSPDPPRERTVGQADPLILPDGTWMVYYAVRNYTSDIQVYLATGTPGNDTPPGPNPPAPTPPNPPPPSENVTAAPSVGFLAALVGWAPPVLVIALWTGIGAVVGGGLAVAVIRLRGRGRV